jgi:hypothetical protein
MKRVLVALVFWVVCWPALAQDQSQSQTQSPAAPAPLQVLIVGDELAGGMGAGLARMAAGEAGIQVANRFNEGSGLARPDLYDWAAAIPKMTEGKNYAAAIVLIGLNDRRDIKDNADTLKFGTPEWETRYKARIDAVIDALAAQHVQVFWMSEPAMGDPALDADMQNLSAMFKDRAAAKGATFIDIRTPFLNAQGGYTDRGPDDTGIERRLRESDGVTFFKQGNNRLGQIALAALKSASPAPPAEAPAAGTPAAANAAAPAGAPATTPGVAAIAGPPAPKPEDTGPIFGQEGDEAPAAQKGSTQLAASVAKEQALKAAGAASVIGIAAAKGSNAETFLTSGLAPAPPAGRFDDFSMTAAP